MKSIFLLYFLIFPGLVLADMSVEEKLTLDKMCSQEIDKVEDCCLRGQCINPSGITKFALTVGPEDIRQFRNYCLNWNGEEIPSCPNGRVIRQHAIFYKGIPAVGPKLSRKCKPDTLTRLVTLSSSEDSTVEFILSSNTESTNTQTPNDSVIGLLGEHKKLCLQEIDEMILKIDKSAPGTAKREPYICDSKMKARLESLKTETTNQVVKLLTSPNDRKEKDGVPQLDFLKNMKQITCPEIQNWYGYFKKNYELNPVEFKIKLNELLKNDWGVNLNELKPGDALSTNECFYRTSEVKPLEPGVPCNGYIYYRTDITKVIKHSESSKVRVPAMKKFGEP